MPPQAAPEAKASKSAAKTQPSAASQLVKAIADTLEDHKVQNLVVLDIRKHSGFADYLIIGTGTSTRHVASLASAVEDHHRPHLLSTEGQGGEWVCTDMGAIVVHIFTADKRALYNLEKLWSYAF